MQKIFGLKSISHELFILNLSAIRAVHLLMEKQLLTKVKKIGLLGLSKISEK